MGFILLGLFIDLKNGIWIGFLMATILLTITLFIGEKVILILLKARYVNDDEDLINQVKNFCLHLEIPEVKVYRSGTFVRNVYFTDSFFGKPSLIVGKMIINELTKNELNALIYASLLKIKLNQAKERTLTALLWFYLLFPVFVLYKKINYPKVNIIMKWLLVPYFYFKQRSYENIDSVLLFDKKVAYFDGLKREYTSALFKIYNFELINSDGVAEIVVSDLVLVKNQSNETLHMLLDYRIDIKERVKHLGNY